MPQPLGDPYASGGVLLDVRSAEEVARGAFPRAIAIPVDELPGRLGELERAAGGRDRPVLVMCRLGRRAERAAALLRDAGFSRVCNIGGVDVEPLRSMLGGVHRQGRPTALQWALYGVRHSALCYDLWRGSLRLGPPNYDALVGAYRHAYGAELNFLDAGVEHGRDGWGWRRAGELRRVRAAELERVMAT